MPRRSVVWAGVAFAMAAASAARAQDPAGAFKAHCAKCHGETGLADTPSGKSLKVKPLADDQRLAGMATPELVAAIKNAAKHKNALAKASDAEIEASAQYTKTIAAAPPR